MRGNTKYGSNPYRGRPIPKGRIEWAVEQANSAAHASRLLNVDKNTFRKYAEMYDLYEGVKNKSGKGISKLTTKIAKLFSLRRASFFLTT